MILLGCEMIPVGSGESKGESSDEDFLMLHTSGLSSGVSITEITLINQTLSTNVI